MTTKQHKKQLKKKQLQKTKKKNLKKKLLHVAMLSALVGAQAVPVVTTAVSATAQEPKSAQVIPGGAGNTQHLPSTGTYAALGLSALGLGGVVTALLMKMRTRKKDK